MADEPKKGTKPARGYSWPPLQPGHTLSLVHGGYSPRAIEARATQVHETLLEVAPYLDEPKFLPAVARYLRAEARAQLLHEAIMDKAEGPKGILGAGARIIEAATAADRLASKLGTELGLDPIGHARIRALSASAEATEASITELMESGREGRRRRLQVLDGEGPKSPDATLSDEDD